MIATLVLTAVLQFQTLLTPTKPIAQIVCSGSVIGFKFIGVEGQKFRLDAQTHTIGKSGFIELISRGQTSFEYEGKDFPLMERSVDEFGFAEVRLPQPEELPPAFESSSRVDDYEMADGGEARLVPQSGAVPKLI